MWDREKWYKRQGETSSGKGVRKRERETKRKEENRKATREQG
jgi:hypothetical protein